MKILHGHVGTEVSVQVAVEGAGSVPVHDEHVEGHGYYSRYGDSTFSVDPHGELYISGDRSKPAHHSYQPDEWECVFDENGTCVFNTLRGGDMADDESTEGESTEDESTEGEASEDGEKAAE